MAASASPRMANRPWKGRSIIRSQRHVNNVNFGGHQPYISGTAEYRVSRYPCAIADRLLSEFLLLYLFSTACAAFSACLRTLDIIALYQVSKCTEKRRRRRWWWWWWWWRLCRRLFTSDFKCWHLIGIRDNAPFIRRLHQTIVDTTGRCERSRQRKIALISGAMHHGIIAVPAQFHLEWRRPKG